MTDQHCQDSAQLIPELALGCLHGQERAAALDHVRRCPRCRQELATYQGLASELLELIPAATPPAGFEARALAAMKAASRPAAPARRARRRPAMLMAAAAVIAVAGIGGYEVSRLVSPQPPPLHTAALIAAGRQIGTAYFYAGSQHWILVTVHLGPKTRTVTCKIEPASGGRGVTIGPLPLTAGQGAWGADVALPWQRGMVALILNSASQTIATGTFRS